MFIGHNAVGFASKKAAPRASLGVLMAAPMLPDLLWPIFLLLGIEHVRIQPGATRWTPLDFNDYPWSHSLLMTVVQAVLFAGGYWLFTRYTRGAIIAFIGVVSHWVLDFLTHRPDLPLWPHGPRVGLGLWNHPIATIAIEAAMFAIAVMVYRDITHPVDRIGSLMFWALVVLLAGIYISMAGGKPPKNVQQIAYLGLSGWLIPIWAAWFDRHRIPEE
jgi:membrane-bound metal-dependent hydrolase YbcI (DUF457 family)